MIKKFGNYQIQIGEVYSGLNGYRVLIDVSTVMNLPSVEIRRTLPKVKPFPFDSPQDIFFMSIYWKTVGFMPSSSANFAFCNSERFYADLLQIIDKIKSKSYLNRQSTIWWETLLSPFEGEYIYLSKLCDTPISISKNDPEKCEIGNDTFLPTEVLFSLIRKISKDSHPDR